MSKKEFVCVLSDSQEVIIFADSRGQARRLCIQRFDECPTAIIQMETEEKFDF